VLRATCLSESGQETPAAAVIDSVLGDVESGVSDSVFTDVIRFEDLATYYALVGDAPAAAAWAERAYRLSPSGIESMVLQSALFDGVRQNPDFREAVSRIRSGIWDRVKTESQQVIVP
ncbi:MAG: hypothetical protein JSW51_05710, partial [Gemmatimonadota bacterium]